VNESESMTDDTPLFGEPVPGTSARAVAPELAAAMAETRTLRAALRALADRWDADEPRAPVRARRAETAQAPYLRKHLDG
jgi:hypothetical protein